MSWEVSILHPVIITVDWHRHITADIWDISIFNFNFSFIFFRLCDLTTWECLYVQLLTQFVIAILSR